MARNANKRSRFLNEVPVRFYAFALALLVPHKQRDDEVRSGDN